MSERAEIDRGLRGRNLIEQVNNSLKTGKSIDANTYFEAITEWEDGVLLHNLDWPKQEAQATYARSLAKDKLLDVNNNPIREAILPKK